MMELECDVTSILNKLTPHKFNTLVDKMLELKIDDIKQLESVIDLIFEKAVSEPGFSVAYANMCRVLTDNFTFSATNLSEETKTSTVAFRKILMIKCQKEFEKESLDEKLLEKDRLKKFEIEEEKKAWEEELDYRKMMNRKRMHGNICFLVELFKLKMISENIMHDCILKLLRAEKQDFLEDQLKCLCKLLSRIGKDLDHAKAKPRMDQYFVRINKIIEKKTISSRIKYDLQDVMDLRVRGWVPRRDKENSQNQIHRKAMQELACPQDKLQQKLRGGRGGQDSANVRSGGLNSNGWTNVVAKSNRGIRTTPIVASKFNLPRKAVLDPSFENIHVKLMWLNPITKAKNLSDEEEKLQELERNVRSILNKLTPQKFKTLVAKMLKLNIDNAKKLESAVDLIFEIAISVPLYIVAFANMCRFLTDYFKFSATNKSEETTKDTITFRKVLLNKCQKEFEKESADEKLLEEDRLQKCDTEEEKKAWKEELDYREMMNRRRMLGNIRFIGELFKLKMISENIMHDCILKLLRIEMQDSLEDQLECLCKLLSTIGKDLDHAKAKPRMDQYFVQINRIIVKKKISSRIKFALRDVMDLRVRDWVPRRDEGNPKTIDKIHREALQEEKKLELARQQDKLQRKFERRGRRGRRDSPNVRLGCPSSDKWTDVTYKSNHAIETTRIVASIFKLTKKVTDSTEISLGLVVGKPGEWSRGVSSLTSRGGTQISGGGRMGSNDGSSSALQAVKDMTGQSSRNSSPARSISSEDTHSAPSSGAETLVGKSQSPVALITEEKMRKTTKSTVEEYLNCRDIKEALLCIKELSCPSMHHVFVEESICVVLEKKPEHRRLVGTLLHYFIKEQLLSTEDMCQGFASMVELAQDLAYDVPLIYKYLGEVLGPVVYDGTLPLNKVKDTLETLVQRSKAGLVIAEALSVAVELAREEDSVGALWCESRVTWDMLLNNDENVETFVKEKKMEFTPKTVSTQSSPSHSSQIQEEMLKIFKEKEDVTNDIMNLITNKVPVEQQSSPDFIRQLTGVVCNSTISTSDNSTTCSCNKELLKKRSNIMRRYINKNRTLELHALYVLQELVTDLNHPRDLLRVLFEELYHAEVISEEAYYDWENSKDFPDGKGVALSTVKSFLEWLKKAEEEQNEEDASTPPTTNVA